VIDAEGELQAAEKLSEAAAILSREPAAISGKPCRVVRNQTTDAWEDPVLQATRVRNRER